MTAPISYSDMYILTLRGLTHVDETKRDETCWAIAELVALSALSALMIGGAAIFAYTTHINLQQGQHGFFHSVMGYYETRTFDQWDALSNYFAALLVAGLGVKIARDEWSLYKEKIHRITRY
jgi:hypothetical protein